MVRRQKILLIEVLLLNVFKYIPPLTPPQIGRMRFVHNIPPSFYQGMLSSWVQSMSVNPHPAQRLLGASTKSCPPPIPSLVLQEMRSGKWAVSLGREKNEGGVSMAQVILWEALWLYCFKTKSFTKKKRKRERFIGPFLYILVIFCLIPSIIEIMCNYSIDHYTFGLGEHSKEFPPSFVLGPFVW